MAQLQLEPVVLLVATAGRQEMLPPLQKEFVCCSACCPLSHGSHLFQKYCPEPDEPHSLVLKVTFSVQFYRNEMS